MVFGQIPVSGSSSGTAAATQVPLVPGRVFVPLSLCVHRVHDPLDPISNEQQQDWLVNVLNSELLSVINLVAWWCFVFELHANICRLFISKFVPLFILTCASTR